MCDGRTYNRAEMSDTFLAAASQRALDLSLPSAPLACRGDSLALLDAQPGDSDSVFFVWLAPYLTATEVLPLLSVARAWRDAGESSRLWNAWAPFSSRQQWRRAPAGAGAHSLQPRPLLLPACATPPGRTRPPRGATRCSPCVCGMGARELGSKRVCPSRLTSLDSVGRDVG